jgi:sodium transport system ATP-binding protein
MIEIRSLQKSFGADPVVDNLSFVARDGAITGLLGSNGAGKSTTLRMICGVLKPDAGTIDAPHTGALLDHTGIYARLTVRENLTYFGSLHGIPQPHLNRRVDELVSILGLDAIANRRIAGFSQGERMKTALGRALVHSPRNLVLDEPTSGLDVPTVRSLHAFLKRMRDEGACIVFSSHQMEEVRTLCDNVVVISKGRLVGRGSPEEICSAANAASFEDAFVKMTAAGEAPVC